MHGDVRDLMREDRRKFSPSCGLKQRGADICDSAGKTVRQWLIGFDYLDVYRPLRTLTLSECRDGFRRLNDLPFPSEFLHEVLPHDHFFVRRLREYREGADEGEDRNSSHAIILVPNW